mmetsp:Transcript_11480/g.25615  ORF Transcript_11480/g.25615 Transcript_11480/m.25615 type:complete len:368 (+) Transcript_11480:71-1174(+)
MDELKSLEKKPRRKRNKKPKDMPRRPLSAYNIFFKEERERILSSQREGKEQEDFVFPSEEELTKQAEKGKKKAPVLFQALARCIGKRWKALPKDRVKEYEGRAKAEMAAYRSKMDEYQQSVVLKSIDESEKLKKSGKKQAQGGEGVDSPDKAGGEDVSPHLAAAMAGNPQLAASGFPFASAGGMGAFGPGAGLAGLQMMQYQQAAAANGFFQQPMPGAMDPSTPYNPATAAQFDPSYFGAPGMMAANMYQFPPQMQQGFAAGMPNFAQPYLQGQHQAPGPGGENAQYGGLHQQQLGAGQPAAAAPGQMQPGPATYGGGFPGMPTAPGAPDPPAGGGDQPSPQRQQQGPGSQEEQQDGQNPFNGEAPV